MVGSRHDGSSENTSHDLEKEREILLVVKRTRKGEICREPFNYLLGGVLCVERVVITTLIELDIDHRNDRHGCQSHSHGLNTSRLLILDYYSRFLCALRIP